MTNRNRTWSPALAVVIVATLTACTELPSEAEGDTSGSEESSSGEPDLASTGALDGSESEGALDGTEDSSGGTPPSCEDGEHNGDEEGVDCGGSCQPCPPADWTCSAGLYGDELCQCGCGTPDVDCATMALSECAYDLCPDGFALEPGQTVDCVEVPPPPADWSCSLLRYGDGECDCGCGAIDFDCVSASSSACASEHCDEAFSLDPDDNAICLPPAADAVDNPSFEETPDGMYDVPGWTVLEDVGGMAYVEISGPGQTTAPEGSRALRLVSTNNDIVGARTVRSSPFLPSGTCTVTVAVGDSNEDSEYTDFGQLRVRAPSLPSPLDLVAEIDIDNRGMGGVSPPLDGYVDAQVTFAADGETLHHVEIRVRASLGTLSYHADDVRIVCSE